MDVTTLIVIALTGYAPSIVLCGFALVIYSFLLRFSYRVRLIAPIALTALTFGSIIILAYGIKGFVELTNAPFHSLVLVMAILLHFLKGLPMVLAVLTPIPFIEKFTTVKQRYAITVAYSLTILPFVLAYKFLGLFTGEDWMRLLPEGFYFDIADLYLIILLPSVPFYVGSILFLEAWKRLHG